MSIRTDPGPDAPAPVSPTSVDATAGMVAAGLAIQAASAPQPEDQVVAQPGARRVIRSRIRRRPARVRTRSQQAARLAGGVSVAAPAAARDTNSELRDWIKENAALLSNASLLISISAIALKALPAEGVLNPYIQALIFAAALILLIEMHYQWPDDLQLHMFRKAAFPQNHSRRMTAFAVLMQLATGLFAIWAALTNPLILFPLAAFGVFLAFRQWYFSRFSGWPARIVGIVAMLAALLLSELLIAIAWALATDQTITLTFGDRPVT